MKTATVTIYNENTMRLKFVSVIVFLILLVGCGAIQEANIKKQVLADPHLNAKIRNAIENGEIKVGMTKNQVIASWGNPCSYCYGARNSSWGDTWEYNEFGSSSYGVGAGTYLFFSSAGILKGWSQ